MKQDTHMSSTIIVQGGILTIGQLDLNFQYICQQSNMLCFSSYNAFLLRCKLSTSIMIRGLNIIPTGSIKIEGFVGLCVEFCYKIRESSVTGLCG